MTTGLSEDRTDLVLTRDDLLRLTPAPGADAEFLAPTLEAVRAPLVTAEVLRLRAGTEALADVWVGEKRTILQARSDQPAHVVSVGWALTPQLIARALDIGPRPRTEGAFRAGVDDVVAALGAAEAPWGALVETATLWRISWEGPAVSAGRVSVLDLGELGYRRPTATEQPDVLDWEPTDGSEIWKALSAFFAVALPL